MDGQNQSKKTVVMDKQTLNRTLTLLLACGKQGRPKVYPKELQEVSEHSEQEWRKDTEKMKDLLRADRAQHSGSNALKNQSVFEGFLQQAGECLLGQPTVFCFPEQTCSLCKGRLAASAQHVQEDITLLTTTGPQKAQLVVKKCKRCQASVHVHTAQKNKEKAILWLNVPLTACGVMRVRANLYIEVALMQQFLNELLHYKASFQQLSEVYARNWARGATTYSLSRDGQDLQRACLLYALAQADWPNIWQWVAQQEGQHTADQASLRALAETPLCHAEVWGSLPAVRPQDASRVLMKFAYGRGKAGSNTGIQCEAEDGALEEEEGVVDDEGKEEEEADYQGGLTWEQREDPEGLLLERAEGAEAVLDEHGISASRGRPYPTSAEMGSIDGHCRTLVSFLVDKAGRLGDCSGACQNPHCKKVWLVDGTAASAALAMHICDLEGCPRPPYQRKPPPSDKRKLLCAFHHQQREKEEQRQEEQEVWQQQQQQQQRQEQQQEHQQEDHRLEQQPQEQRIKQEQQQPQEQQQEQQLEGCKDQAKEDSSNSSSSKVYMGGARMGGVNGVFAPCGHIIGLSPQYGHETPEDILALLEKLSTTNRMPQVVIYNDALPLLEHLHKGRQHPEIRERNKCHVLLEKWGPRLCLDVMRFNRLYAGTFSRDNEAGDEELQMRREQTAALSPFQQDCLLKGLSPAGVERPSVPHTATPSRQAGVEGGLKWGDVLRIAPKQAMDPLTKAPFKLHQASAPSAIRVLSSTLRELGIPHKQQTQQAGGSGYIYLQVQAAPVGEEDLKKDVLEQSLRTCNVKVFRLCVNTSAQESGWKGLGMTNMANIRSMTHDHALVHLFAMVRVKNEQLAEDRMRNAAYRRAIQQQRGVEGTTDREEGTTMAHSPSVPAPLTPSQGVAACGASSSAAALHSPEYPPRRVSKRLTRLASSHSPSAAASPAAPAAEAPVVAAAPIDESSTLQPFDLSEVQHWRRPSSKGGYAKLVTPAVSSAQLFGLQNRLGLIDFWPKQLLKMQGEDVEEEELYDLNGDDGCGDEQLEDSGGMEEGDGEVDGAQGLVGGQGLCGGRAAVKGRRSTPRKRAGGWGSLPALLINSPSSAPSPITPEGRQGAAALGSSGRTGGSSFPGTSASSETHMGIGIPGRHGSHGDHGGCSTASGSRGTGAEKSRKGVTFDEERSVSRGPGQASAHRLQQTSMHGDKDNRLQHQHEEQGGGSRKRLFSCD